MKTGRARGEGRSTPGPLTTGEGPGLCDPRPAARSRECTLASAFLKMTTERGQWLVELMDAALDAHLARDYNRSSILYLLAAEQGRWAAASARSRARGRRHCRTR